jgi:hypothetical protein
MKTVIWIDDHNCQIEDIKFSVETGKALYEGESPQKNNFIIGKSRRMIETLVALDFNKSVKNICEIGIYKGGSIAFYHKLFNPEKIVAFDLQEKQPEILDQYIDDNALGNVIKTYYGVDQSDRYLLEAISVKEIGSAFYDVIVDDASHLLEPTRLSFNALFPKLRCGGYYLIEDWGWAHWNRPEWQDNGGPWKEQRPLSNLVFEICMLMASRPDLIESVKLLPAYAIIRKGSAVNIDRDYEFDILDIILNRGKSIKLLD